MLTQPEFGSGWATLSKVSSYSATGWTHDLPDLKIARKKHACSFYTTDSGDNVGFSTSFNLLYVFLFQISDSDGDRGI